MDRVVQVWAMRSVILCFSISFPSLCAAGAMPSLYGMSKASPEGPPPSRRLLPLVAAALAGAIIVTVVAARLLSGHRAQELPVIGVVPWFELVDHNAAPFTSSALEGRVWVASFIYTTCPGPCPRVVQRVGNLARDFQGEPRLRFVSFSVDPQADTPPVLSVYARTHAIDTSKWKLVTGPPERIFELVRDGFFLSIARAEGNDVEAIRDQGPIIHSTRLVLIDGAGRIRGYYDSEDRVALDRLANDIRGLIGRLNT